MNTRAFLKSLATIVVAPSILIPRAKDAYRFIRTGCPVDPVNPLGRFAEINPEWEAARYEIMFLMPTESVRLVEKSLGYKLRYVMNKETRLFERAEPVIHA